MKVTVITLFPEMFENAMSFGVTARAFKEQGHELRMLQLRDYSIDKHRTVDDKPYGGGPGMLLKAEPLLAAIDAARAESAPGSKVVYFSPAGERLLQSRLHDLAQTQNDLILVCGRYEGVDERVIELAVDIEVSIGDYVLSGGEIPALALIDGLARLLPGVLGDAMSTKSESFVDGRLEYPQYTRPEEVAGRRVPSVLLSGDHGAIEAWREKEGLRKTQIRRPDLIQENGQ
ncbi:MAG: tRNA (guanosine(37)-N1)-methyltransferase TrmD [Pseudomonadota bacterium]|nr:tRNA (guanosine(37)-N1)-methyltransferase TrmD [Pseudomonadota bacterium]